jgi:hypothetical protein
MPTFVGNGHLRIGADRFYLQSVGAFREWPRVEGDRISRLDNLAKQIDWLAQFFVVEVKP